MVALLAVFAMHAAGSGHDHGGSMSTMSTGASGTGQQAMAMQHRAPQRPDAPSRTGSKPAMTASSACAAAALTAPPCLVVDQLAEPSEGSPVADEPGAPGCAPEPPVPRSTLFI